MQFLAEGAFGEEKGTGSCGTEGNLVSDGQRQKTVLSSLRTLLSFSFIHIYTDMYMYGEREKSNIVVYVEFSE